MGKLKVFCWKTIDKNFNYVEVKIKKDTHEKAEKELLRVCEKLNLKPIEYLGWEE